MATPGRLGVIATPAGPVLRDLRPRGFWAMIDGRSGTAYAFTEQWENGSGTFTDLADGNSGTTTRNPAYEVNGSTVVPTGTIVWMWPSIDGIGWTFSYPSGAGGVLQTVSPAQITANQNNYSPSATANYWILTSSGPVEITGLGNPVPGRTVTITNNGSYPITFVHQSGSSTTTNQITTPTGTPLILPPCHTVTFGYAKGGDPPDKWGVVTPVPTTYEPLTPAQITSDPTGLNPGSPGAPLVSITSNNNYTLHGIIPGSPYLVRTFINSGAYVLTIPHNSGTAGDPTYAIHTPNDLDFAISPGRTFSLYYDPVLGANVISGGTAAADPLNAITAGTPAWVKVTKSYTDFSDASTSKTVTLYTLPARGILHKVLIKSSTAWAGTGVTNVLGSVKNNTNTVTTLDLDTAVADSHYSAVEDRDTVSTPYTGLDYVTFAGTRAVALTVDTTGANLDQLTAGAVDVWLLVSKLP